ncbi:MAG: putative secretion activating protein [Verrucomicrobiaceae bacterium]|nr:putative secretion activating protein [Verrucomicrobiaceae bacterium]
MSASFDAAYQASILSSNEGGYQLSNIPGDKGGQTFAGIARNFHSDWYGWQLIDSGAALNSTVLIDLVRDFYWKEFWLPINGENLPPRIAQQVFDMAINSACDDAAKCLQLAIGTLLVDGSIGAKTCCAVSGADPIKLAARFNAQRARHFAKCKPLQPGWFNRLADQIERGVA